MQTENKILDFTIYQKLQQIQSDLKAPKGQYNNFGKYKYRSCEDILEALKPHLKANQLTLVLTDELVCLLDRIYVKGIAVLSNGKESITVNGFAREEVVKKGMDGSQITGTSSSYARKYALNGMFLIDDTKDSDHTNGISEPEPAKAPEPAPSPVMTVVQFNRALGSDLKGVIATLKHIASGKLIATVEQIEHLESKVFDFSKEPQTELIQQN